MKKYRIFIPVGATAIIEVEVGDLYDEDKADIYGVTDE